MNARQEALRQRLISLGFDEVRFARAAAVPADSLNQWIQQGFHADMAWMERTAAKRLNPELVLAGVRSMIMLGVNYWQDEKVGDGGTADGSPRWARYAVYQDYHDTLKPALVAAGRAIEEIFGASATDYRYYVDTGPVLERGWAERAGVGFWGKNGMLISRTFGNWLFLAAVLTRLEFAADEPLRNQAREAGTAGRIGLLCGKCTRCIDACPTQAIPEPGVIDARRCISYQTIENRGIIPREFRLGIGDHIYGCDVCLDVCPWNRFARAGRQMLLARRPGITALSLGELLSLTPSRFAEVFRGTPINRLKLTGLLRNACVAAGNVAANAGCTHELMGPLLRLAAHPAPQVQVHAIWAVHRVAGSDATRLLRPLRNGETDALVLEEYAACERDSAVS